MESKEWALSVRDAAALRRTAGVPPEAGAMEADGVAVCRFMRSPEDDPANGMAESFPCATFIVKGFVSGAAERD